uniref:Uncharacterized protein n=1 Tax=Arundo donax TaxID=35708 RepID=A0A0A8Y2Q1_ARUDO
MLLWSNLKLLFMPS